MTTQSNGTYAKEVALHFISVTGGRMTPSLIKRTIIQAKSLLEDGFTKQQILDSIDYIVDVKKVDMYSLGYVNASISEIIKEVEDSRLNKIGKEEIKKMDALIPKEVIDNGQSTKNNRDKAERFGSKPRFGEEFDFDMFKGQ